MESRTPLKVANTVDAKNSPAKEALSEKRSSQEDKENNGVLPITGRNVTEKNGNEKTENEENENEKNENEKNGNEKNAIEMKPNEKNANEMKPNEKNANEMKPNEKNTNEVKPNETKPNENDKNEVDKDREVENPISLAIECGADELSMNFPKDPKSMVVDLRQLEFEECHVQEAASSSLVKEEPTDKNIVTQMHSHFDQPMIVENPEPMDIDNVEPMEIDDLEEDTFVPGNIDVLQILELQQFQPRAGNSRLSLLQKFDPLYESSSPVRFNEILEDCSLPGIPLKDSLAAGVSGSSQEATYVSSFADKPSSPLNFEDDPEEIFHELTTDPNEFVLANENLQHEPETKSENTNDDGKHIKEDQNLEPSSTLKFTGAVKLEVPSDSKINSDLPKAEDKSDISTSKSDILLSKSDKSPSESDEPFSESDNVNQPTENQNVLNVTYFSPDIDTDSLEGDKSSALAGSKSEDSVYLAEADRPIVESVTLVTESNSLLSESLPEFCSPLPEFCSPLPASDNLDHPSPESDNPLLQSDKPLPESALPGLESAIPLPESENSVPQIDIPVLESGKHIQESTNHILESVLPVAAEISPKEKDCLIEDTHNTTQDKVSCDKVVEKLDSLVEESGQLIEESGHLVKESGHLVEESSPLVPESGLVEEAAHLIEESTHLVPELGKPITEPVQPLTKSDKHVAEINKSFTGSDKPIESNKLIEETDKTLVEINKTVVEFDNPILESDKPIAESVKPIAEPDKPITEPDKPIAEPDSPISEPDKPFAEYNETIAESNSFNLDSTILVVAESSPKQKGRKSPFEDKTNSTQLKVSLNGSAGDTIQDTSINAAYITCEKFDEIEGDVSADSKSTETQTEPNLASILTEENLKDMAELVNNLEQETSDLKLQLNQSQQVRATLELQLRQKEEIIIKTQAEALKKDQYYKQEVKNLTEKLNSIDKDKDEVSEVEELRKKLEESQAREEKLLKQVSLKSNDEGSYKQTMDEYQKVIDKHMSELEKLRQEHDTAKRHLATLEVCFSDVHSKYERSKTIITGYKNNEETLTQSLQATEEEVRKNAEKYESLKAHAKAQIEKSNRELNQAREKHQAEVHKLTAIVKRMEIKVASLTKSLEQKTNECAELAALCDDITGRVN